MKTLKQILLYADGELLELYLGVFSLLWGLWCILPMDSFRVSGAFALLGRIAPEHVWGIVVAGVGAVKIFAVVKKFISLKKIAFVAALFLWLCVAISFIAGLPFSVGLPIYSLTAFANFFCLWRNGK